MAPRPVYPSPGRSDMGTRGRVLPRKPPPPKAPLWASVAVLLSASLLLFVLAWAGLSFSAPPGARCQPGWAMGRAAPAAAAAAAIP